MKLKVEQPTVVHAVDEPRLNSTEWIVNELTCVRMLYIGEV